MKGLIVKDLLLIKENIKQLVLFVLVFVFIGLQGNQILVFVPAFLSMMMFLSTFSYDDYNKWNSYAVTLPNGRKNIVKAKYIASIFLSLVAILFTYLLVVLFGVANHNLNLEETTTTLLGCWSAIILLQSIMYPLIFKLGIEKGRIFLLVLVFGISALIGLLFQNIKISLSTEAIHFLDNYLLIILPFLMVIILYISYKISEKIVQKKEF